MNKQFSFANQVSDINRIRSRAIRYRQVNISLNCFGRWQKNRWDKQLSMKLSVEWFLRVTDLRPSPGFDNRSRCGSLTR